MKIVDNYTGYVAILACSYEDGIDSTNCDFAILKLDDYLFKSLKDVKSISDSIRSSGIILGNSKIDSINLFAYNCSAWFLSKNIYLKDNLIKSESLVYGLIHNVEFDEGEVEHADDFGEFALEKYYQCLNEVPEVFTLKYFPGSDRIVFSTGNVFEYGTFGIGLEELINLIESNK